MAQPITWLHLSDIHLCEARTGWAADRVLKALGDDFKRLNACGLVRPDLIFVTGDLAFGQLSEMSLVDQYVDVFLLLEEIRESFDEPVPAERVFLVPGNHDVNRRNVIEELYDSLDKTTDDKVTHMMKTRSQIWKTYMNRLDEYREFVKSSYPHLLQDNGLLNYALTFEIRGVKLGVAGFNSAWSCGRDGEKGRVWLGAEYQGECLFRPLMDCELRFALMHHPPSWLVSQESRFGNRVQDDFHFFLHGHEHDLFVRENAEGHCVIAAGAVHGDTPDECGYNFGAYDPVTRTGEIRLRRFEASGKTWVPWVSQGKTDDHGVWRIGKGTPLPPDPPPAGPATGEEANGPASRGVFGRDSLIKALTLKLEQSAYLSIHGMPGVGKSTLVDELVRAQARKPFPVQLHAYTSFADFYQLLAPALGCKDEVPKLPQNLLGQIDWSAIKAFAAFSEPSLIHLTSFHHLLDGEGFKDARFADFFAQLPALFPKLRFVLESRVQPGSDCFSDKLHQAQRLYGLDQASMEAWLAQSGWRLNETEAAALFKGMGGRKQKHGALPMALKLFIALAKAHNGPAEVLQRYNYEFQTNVEQQLFNDLYDHVLNPGEQHMLRLCALYREEIPHEHTDRLVARVGDGDAFANLRRRSLLSADAGEHAYALHSLIAELTTKRCKADDKEADHECLADAWLAGVRGGAGNSLRNILTTSEASYHLLAAERYDRLHQLSERYLREGSHHDLFAISNRLQQQGRIQDNKCVLELLVRLDPDDHRSHRFLGETLERLDKRGNDQALFHHREAHRLNPSFPPYLANLGRAYLARKEPALFLEQVAQLEASVYKQAVDDTVQSILADALKAVGQSQQASNLRQKLIDAGSRDPAFYVDEARYLHEQGRSAEALALLDRGEKQGAANAFSQSIRARILEASGSGDEASCLRMAAIDAGSRDPAFYNDEARYLHERGRSVEALALLDRGEKQGAADAFSQSIRARILEASGSGDDASRQRMAAIDAGSRHPAFYNDEARYLHEQGRSVDALALLDRGEKQGAANAFSQSIRASILEASGSGDEASRLRMAAIDAGSRHPALYVDEARYLHEQGRSAEALALLDRGEKQGAANAFSQSIRASILEATGSGDEASRLRMAAIDAGSRNPVFYCDEARYLHEQGRSAEALALLDRGEKQGAADSYTATMREHILRSQGAHEQGTD